MGSKAFAVQQDVSEVDGLAGTVEKVVEALGPIDILVNNAAIADVVPIISSNASSSSRHSVST